MKHVDTAKLAQRVDELEARVNRLEHQPQPSAEPSPLEAGTDPDTFWILAGLKARLGARGAVTLAGIVPLAAGEEYQWQFGRTSDDLLQADWSQFSATIASLGHPVRLTLLKMVLAGTRSSAELQAAAELGTTGQFYHHLRQLIAAGWLTQTRRGQYAVPGDRIIALLATLLAAER